MAVNGNYLSKRVLVGVLSTVVVVGLEVVWNLTVHLLVKSTLVSHW